MKIYFYDGSLDKFPAPKIENYTIVDAKLGVSKTLNALDGLSKAKENVAVVSNSVLALDHEFGWNEEEKHTDIYIWSESLKEYIKDSISGREKWIIDLEIPIFKGEGRDYIEKLIWIDTED